MFPIGEDKKDLEISELKSIETNDAEFLQNVSYKLESTSQINLLHELREINYFPYQSLSSPTMYSSVSWLSQHKLLIGTKENNLKEIYFKRNDDCLETVYRTNKINSSSIVSSIDIIDVDKFSVLAITLVNKQHKQNIEHYYLNIYCDFETKNLDLILECQHAFTLDTLAHRVTNLTYFNAELIKEKFIFVNCNKRKNILFKIDIEKRNFEKIENIEAYFREYKFENLPHNITTHDTKYTIDKSKRISAIGCQNGWIGVYLVETIQNVILKTFEYENDSFITAIKLFRVNTNCFQLDMKNINLLVVSALEPSRIFRNIFNGSFDDIQDLQDSNSYDLITSAVIYDATFDQMNTIVLGTFGKRVLFYCYNSNDCTYELKRELVFKHSIMGLSLCNLSSNGAYDLAVVTLNGVSIWQFDTKILLNAIEKKFKNSQTSSE